MEEMRKEGDDPYSGFKNKNKSEIETYTYFLEINFSSLKELSFQQTGFFPEAKFIEINKNKFALTPAYQGYSLVQDGE
ncbi:MAG: hypothetical protein EOO01_33105 [Chitinophagaceae bacterium]|nr:MAG: hypothetical protein EOO01_33105 [Chitinophagaceae bacterium]